MKSFDIPEFYRSPVISRLKTIRKNADPKKKDFRPSILNFGAVEILIARHFGFCYGVENAVEISFRAVTENPDKRVFLLSQMIHNPEVNRDLVERGVKFLMDTNGQQLVPWEALTSDDIVIIPAFGTTIAIEKQLEQLGIEPQRYNTTCPFVERVWKKSAQLGEGQYTIIIHGKPKHEETRATFSHSEIHSASIVVKDMDESIELGQYILGNRTRAQFDALFGNRTSPGFDPDRDLQRVGVINQTTMLASDTQGIADYFKQVMQEKFAAEEEKKHFADTRDTLCYATNENQQATFGLLESNADLALVVGGYNSSNTSHLVELCEQKFPTYFIQDETEIKADHSIHHFDLHTHAMRETPNWLPTHRPLRIVLTSGASCPDSVVERVLNKILEHFDALKSTDEVLAAFEASGV